MSSMAKIFVVVNLLLIVAVFGSAATLLGAQDNYREELEETASNAEKTNEALEDRIRKEVGKLASQTADCFQSLGTIVL